MTRVARYVIVLDRYDDDDYEMNEHTSSGLNDGTEAGGCAQVAAELQEAMEITGQPAGFFNVIAREVYAERPESANVCTLPSDSLRQPVADMLSKAERSQQEPA